MINSIKIDRFRSFSDPCEIPLTPFTLLFGSNGSGKSSILESIELCMSGTSSRTHASSVSATVEEVRTAGHMEGLSIQLLDKKNQVICAFDDSGPTLTSPRLLEEFYRRPAHHRTAQSLLATLFATHNLITQERVVRLLDAESKEAFDKVTKEMVAGPAIVERWDKFQRLSSAVSKAHQEAMETETRVKAELEYIESSIKGLYSVQEKDLVQKSRDIYKTLMDISLKNINDPQNNELKSLLKWAQEVAVLLKKARMVVQGVRSSARETKVLNLIEIQCLLDKSNKNLLETSKLIEEMKKEIEDIHLLSSKTSETCIMKKGELRDQVTLLEELKARLADMRVIKEWRSELLADFISKNMEKERNTLNMELFRFNKASRFFSQLPSIQQLDMTTSAAHNLRNDYDAKKQIQDTLESEARQTTEQLRKLKESFSSWNQSKNSMIAQYEHLNALVESIFSVRSNLSICPACGTRFPDSQLLMTKIRENIAILRNAEGSLPERFRSIPVLEAQLKESQEKLSSHSELVQNIVDALREHEKQIQAWDQPADQLKQTLATLRFPGIEGQTQTDLRTFCNYARSIDLSKYQQDLQRKINAFDSQLTEQWHGLRKEQYVERATKITEMLKNMPELKIVLADTELLTKRIEEAEQRLKQLTEKKDCAEREMDGWLVQAESLKGKAEIEKTRLSELRVQKNEQENKVKELGNLLSGANEINSLLLRPFLVLNMEDLQKKIETVSAHIEGLEESLVALLQSLNSHRNYEERKKDITNQRDQNHKKLLLIERLSKGIKTVKPLEGRLWNEWQQYRSHINDLFLKLQTPPDFSEIKLHGETLNFNLMAISRTSQEAKPANVLSSGQRSALAIAIFWTMNLYGSYSPPLMLMDEPIQQIDDINSLNFLDTLRWIADGGKRQIIISTASSRIAGLIRRKFSYLEENFSEILLERHLGVPVIKLFDHAGRGIDEQEEAVHG